MSSPTGPPQQHPPGEGLQPDPDEGVQDNQRLLISTVDISPHSIVTPTSNTEGLQSLSTPTPNPSNNPRPSAEQVHSHVTAKAFTYQPEVVAQNRSPDNPQDIHMTEAQQSHVTQNPPTTLTQGPGHVTTSNPQTPMGRLFPTSG